LEQGAAAAATTALPGAAAAAAAAAVLPVQQQHRVHRVPAADAWQLNAFGAGSKSQACNA
jgi:hypothetical protein